ncbi:MAG: TFIIB-type zinc ribbon-containing protein, partial [Chloroflexota bacterium]
MTTPDLPSISPVTEVNTVKDLWGVAFQPAGCPACKQVFLIDPARLGLVCPACGQSKLEAQPALLRCETPELLAPFRVQRAAMAAALNAFVKDVWLRPVDFSPESLMQRLTPVYWPMWLVDSDVHGDWQGEAGYDYQVKSSRESYRSGQWQSDEVVETRVRWEPRLGQLRRHYDNISVPALSEHDALIRETGSYALDQAAAYKPDLVGQAALRVPDLQPTAAWPQAQSRLNRAASEDCARASGAQHTRNFTIQAQYEGLHWSQLMLPLYVSYYTDDQGQRRLVYINGQSGKVGGLRLASQRNG